MEEAEELRKQFQKLILEDEEKKGKLKYEARMKKQNQRKAKQQAGAQVVTAKGLKIVSMEEKMKK